MPKRVEVNKTLRGRMNFKGRLFKKQTNFATKLQRKHADLQPEQNKPQNYSKIWIGRVLGSIWGGFGRLWAVLGPLWGAFWLFVGRSKSYLCKTLVQHWLQEAFWIDFGSILGRAGEDLGNSWEDLGSQNWSLCVTWSSLEHTVCLLQPHTLLQEPPRRIASPRGASQYAGVPTPDAC